MTGRRVYVCECGPCPPMERGDYMFLHGLWVACCPADDRIVVGLKEYQVTEHWDGTITVWPSIVMERSFGDPPRTLKWCGYLERGEWRSI